VVAGEISNAITLNRYAYANGNPISNVDPLGMASIALPPSFIYDREKREKAFKDLENGALRMESVLNAGSTSKQSEKNLSYNSEIDIKNQIIPYQREAPYSNLMLGNNYISENGCEVIAVNNAMNLLKYDTSMAELIYIFETSGAVIGGSLIGGAFGSNPYSLPKVFDQLGLGYETVSIDEMGENGVYIISYWNSSDYGAMIHTIAIEKTDTGYELYNLDGNYTKKTNNTVVNDLSKYESGFITGYEIYRRK